MAITTTVNLSNLEFRNRIDGELYNPRLMESFFELKRSNLELIPINSFCRIKSGTTPKDRDDTLKEGPVLFKTTDIRNNVLSPFDTFYHISESIHNRMTVTKLKPYDVLLNIVGATLDVIGRSSIIMDDFQEANITQAMAFLRIRKKAFLPGYLFAFLNTKYAQNQIKRYARPTGQFNLNLVEVGKLMIPQLSFTHQQSIENLIVDCAAYQKQSHVLYRQAETLLAQELQLDKMKLSNKKWYSANYCEVVENGRCDGEYYQPKYLQIETHIKSYKKGYSLIKDCFCENKCVSALSEDNYKYIEIGDVNISDGTYKYNTIAKMDLPVSARIELAKGDLLISTVRPYRGAVSIVYDSFSDLIGSSAFTVVREKKGYRKEVLMVLLRLDSYKELLMKWNVGTSYPVINNKDIMGLVIPMIPNELQDKISSLVQQAFSAKQKSKSLLAQAKHRVEELIEQEANKYK